MGDLLVTRVDDRRCRGDCRTAAYGGSNPDEDTCFAVNFQQFADDICRNKGGGQSEAHQEDRLAPDIHHVVKIHAEAKKNDRILQQLFGCVSDTVAENGGLFQ
jgi:hypothetical protein